MSNRTFGSQSKKEGRKRGFDTKSYSISSGFTFNREKHEMREMGC
jgi:hypothetical protein